MPSTGVLIDPDSCISSPPAAGGGMSGRDRLGTLPDDLVKRVLSFLPSRDAVKLSGLARRWRHLWRSAPAVRVKGSGDEFRLFVNSLLLHRDVTSPLLSFEIEADNLLIGGEDFDDEYACDYDFDPRQVDPHVDLWIKHAVWTCRARSLTARFQDESVMWFPDGSETDGLRRQPFASPHLTTMHLHHVELHELLDISCCRALLNLTLSHCLLNGDALISPWLERLNIIDCDIPMNRNTKVRMGTRIATPRLRYLKLSGDYEYLGLPGESGSPAPPSLESMPLLTSASIQLTGDITIYVGDDAAIADRPWLLHGLSEATSLELMASTDAGRDILLMDLTWCPTFAKLKTLILNEWCVYDDVSALKHLMRHTPRLENLILRLKFEKPHAQEVKTKGSNTSKHPCSTFEHLKTVEIKKSCPELRVNGIKKLLSNFGIPKNKIRIYYKKSQGKKRKIMC